jgi:sulfatase maturation enzyme AslB (radical SAM superfamily)
MVKIMSLTIIDKASLFQNKENYLQISIDGLMESLNDTKKLATF